ncbi:hypothetical protein PRVXH_000231 [Proteinivorax hydrogeniformans]|uniref:Iron-only hydrogenase system regulator n=1 Tax=Proteinivorax hydrogeniformans TaxID=1826727 RepID=A0AAU8HU85_9FIRM
MYNVMTVLVNNRKSSAIRVQELLTESGCIIKTRLGLNGGGEACSDEGLIILELKGDREKIQALEGSLNKVEGVKAKNIELSSDD